MPSKQLIKKTLRSIGRVAEKHGATFVVDENGLIDDEHLNPFWYSGEIGHIEYRSWNVSVETSDEAAVAFSGRLLGKEEHFEDTDGVGGYVSPYSEVIRDDAALSYLTNEKNRENENYIAFSVKPRLRISFQDDEGDTVDLLPAGKERIAEGLNVLDALGLLPDCVRYIDEYIKQTEQIEAELENVGSSKNAKAVPIIDRMIECGDSFTEEELDALKLARSALDQPLLAFIKNEVDYRMTNVLWDDVTEKYGKHAITLDLISYLVEQLDENSGVMFDFDAIDEFLLNETDKYMAGDKQETEG